MRYRVLKIYDHNSIKSAIAFVDEVRARLPMAIQRIQTDHGSEFATDFTWHLHDLGIAHRRIPRSSPTSCEAGSMSTTTAASTLPSGERHLQSASSSSASPPRVR